MEATGTALITGANRGLGQAITLELLKRGFDVVASMRNPDAGGELLAKAKPIGGSLRLQALDITRPESIEVPECLRVLVNNAGVDGINQPVEHTNSEHLRQVFDTNFFGLAELTQRAIPYMRRAGAGVICNITSASLLVPVPFFSVYRASKAAVSAFGESLRSEMRPFGIRILEIMPGPIETEMLSDSPVIPDAVEHAAYQDQAERYGDQRQATLHISTPPAEAAQNIVDAILDDAAPLRVACDSLGQGLLDAWRSQSDEDAMRPMLEAFSPGS